jgi:hypothetical protein
MVNTILRGFIGLILLLISLVALFALVSLFVREPRVMAGLTVILVCVVSACYAAGKAMQRWF